MKWAGGVGLRGGQRYPPACRGRGVGRWTSSGQAKVAYVYPGSPAQGELTVGDVIDAVEAPRRPRTQRHWVVPRSSTRLHCFYPGQKVRLVVDRHGQYLNVPITLGRWSPAIDPYLQAGQDIVVSM